MLISIDHGNYAVKTPNDAFISGLSEHSVQPPLASDTIEYSGRFWTLTGNRIPNNSEQISNIRDVGLDEVSSYLLSLMFDI
jgi:hypothetical protein